MQLHREPLPLYALLEEAGFAWQTRAVHDMTFEILIWRRDDARAQTDVQRFLTEDTGA